MASGVHTGPASAEKACDGVGELVVILVRDV